MSRTFGALLAERRAALVGRDDELAALATLLEPDGPLVAVVHGVAGSGKSALLRAFGAAAAERGAAVVAVDGRAVEPTPQGFLAAVEPALAAARRPGRCCWSTPPSGCGCSTAGCARSFLPSLPEHARVVLADARRAGRRVARVVRRAAAGRAARPAGAGGRGRGAASRRARRDAGRMGQPLRRAGTRCRSSWRRRRCTSGRTPPRTRCCRRSSQELAALYLDGLDPATREALDATSVLRRVTLSLLGALLPDEPPQAPFARLAALPFVELGREGLVVHDTVREAVAALLRATDPVRHRAYRGAAWRQIRRELRGRRRRRRAGRRSPT